MRTFSGDQVKILRMRKGWRPERLALEIDRSAASIFVYESGRGSPDVATLAKLADALDCTVDEMFVERRL